MKLRKPCPEGKYDAHVDVLPCPGHFADWPPGTQMSCTVRHELHCPGGVFLPDDTLVIEKVDGEWPEWAVMCVDYHGWHFDSLWDALNETEKDDDALSVREAE